MTGEASPGPAWVHAWPPRIILSLVLALGWFVPLDFITLTSETKAVVLVASVVLVCLGVATASRQLRRAVIPGWAAFFLCLQSLALISGYPSLGYVALVLFVFGGLLVGRGYATSMQIAIGASICGWLITVEQWLTHSYSYVTTFGAPLLPLQTYGGYRTRGTLGEPLAVVAVFGSLLTLAAVRAWLDKGRPVSHSACFMLMAVTLALATGSRTALFVPVIALVVAAAISRRDGERRSLRWLAFGTVYGVAVLGVCLLAVAPSVLGSVGETTRALEFADLSQTESYTVRSTALSAIVQDVESGSVPQLLLGRGDRALQRYLENTNVLDGFDTGDDQYLTLSYDFGLVGVVALLLCWFVAMRSLRRARTTSEVAAAVGLTCWLIFGFFMDNLYLFSGDIVVGLMLGWTLGSGERPPAPILAEQREVSRPTRPRAYV